MVGCNFEEMSYLTNYVVVQEIFEAKNRKEANIIYGERKLKTIRHKVIVNRLKETGFIVNNNKGCYLMFSGVFALRGSLALRLECSEIIPALKAYNKELKEDNKLKKKIGKAIERMEKGKVWNDYVFVPKRL